MKSKRKAKLTMRKKKNLRTIRCGLCVLAGLACSIIFLHGDEFHAGTFATVST